MVQFLETTQASAEIRKLITSSKEKLYLISPYLQISKQLKLLIQQSEQTNPMIDIKVVCRKDKINADDMSFLQELKNVKISALDNLHAKCYLNENFAIITSMNLYQFSQENNWEMGVKIDKIEDQSLYEDILGYIQNILGASEKYEMKKVESSQQKEVKTQQVKPSIQQKSDSKSKTSPANGYCIRCGEKIPFNPNRPLCDKCYPIWAKFSDPKYFEKYCHVCRKEDTKKERCYEKPICYSCYKKLYK
jgi:hypothetical protein